MRLKYCPLLHMQIDAPDHCIEHCADECPYLPEDLEYFEINRFLLEKLDI